MSIDEGSTVFILADKETAKEILGTAITDTADSIPPVRYEEPAKKKEDKCPRCENMTLIEIEKGGQICTVCGWPDKEDARKRVKSRKTL